MDIRQRRRFLGFDVEGSLGAASAASHQYDGQIRVVVHVGLPMPLPRRYSVWSSKEPSPSGVDLSFSTKYAKSDMWYALILASLASFSGLSAWCDTGWCGSGTPIWGYVRVLTSRANWNVMTRVISDCRARACRSNIN